MSTLSDLTSAGRTDVIPDYILSRPRLIEIGKAEDEFARRYLDTLAKGCAGLPTRVATDVMQKGADDIRLGSFAWGGEVFGIWAMARSSVPMLTLYSLQVKHPQLTLDDVAAMYQKGDSDRIAVATWELWGFPGPDEPGKKKRRAGKRPGSAKLDWRGIFKRITDPAPAGLGYPADQFRYLTLPQLTAMLGGKAEANDGDIEALRREKSDALIDAVCESHGIAPSDLQSVKEATLIEWVKAEMPVEGRGRFELPIFRRMLNEYVADYG